MKKKLVCQNCDSTNDVQEYKNGDEIKFLCCYCACIFGSEYDSVAWSMSAMFNVLEENLKKELRKKK